MALFNIADFREFSRFFVETGSGDGEGIRRALAAGFSPVLSVEVHKPLYEHCQIKFALWPDVHLFLGKSEELLAGMIYGKPACVFFLDAHPAGPHTGGHVELLADPNCSFKQDTILRRELEIIADHSFDNRVAHTILIDDCNASTRELDEYYKGIIKSIGVPYSFKYMDEQLPNIPLSKNKILVCAPKG